VPDSDSDWNSTGKVFWQKEIDLGTVRALLTNGLAERFPIGGQERIRFFIFMETRLRSYIENIYLTKKSETKYDARLEFGGAKPSYVRSMTLNVVNDPPRSPQASSSPSNGPTETVGASDEVAVQVHRGTNDVAAAVVAPAQEIAFVPSVDVLYDAGTKAMNFINRGPTNIYLWGDRLDDGPKSIDAPRTITPGGAYHIWANQVADELLIKIGANGQLSVKFDVYVSSENKKKHILHYLLLATTRNGLLNIETQNLGTTDEDF
jgi:hypothetical protein